MEFYDQRKKHQLNSLEKELVMVNAKVKFIEEFIKLSRFDLYNVSLIDGIKISNDESWGLIRASNTSPKITLRFESATEDGLKSIKNDIKNAILKIDNKLDLPF